MNGLDALGADEPSRSRISFGTGALALVAGVVGAIVIRKHPVLGFINAAALASNTHAVLKGQRTWQNAARRMGLHVVATAGSLAMPKHPAIGYVAGAVAGDLLVDGQGGGIIEEWAHHVDAEIQPDHETKALVKTP